MRWYSYANCSLFCDKGFKRFAFVSVLIFMQLFQECWNLFDFTGKDKLFLFPKNNRKNTKFRWFKLPTRLKGLIRMLIIASILKYSCSLAIIYLYWSNSSTTRYFKCGHWKHYFEVLSKYWLLPRYLMNNWLCSSRFG